jgi:hypothetical protein
MKVSYILGFLSISLFSVLVYTTELKGYEISLYTSIPETYWIFFLLPFIIGITYSIAWIRAEKHQTLPFLYAILLILISGLIFASLPILKGYTFWGSGDPATHFATIDYILNTGYFMGQLIYPVSHVLVSGVTIVTRSEGSYVFLRSGLFFIIPALSGFYLMSREILRDKTQIRLFITMIGVLLYGLGIYYYPINFAYILGPIFIFLLFKASQSSSAHQKRYMGLLIVLCLFFIPLHPHVVAAFIIIMSTFVVFHYVYQNPEYAKFKFMAILTILLTVIFYMWYSQFYLFQLTLTNIAEIFSNSMRPSDLDLLLQTVATANAYGINPIEIFIKTYFNSVIILVFTCFSVYFIYRDWKKGIKNYSLLALFPSIIIFIILTIILYTGEFNGYGPERFLGFALILCLFPTVYALHQIFVHRSKNNFANLFKVFLLFLLILSMGIMNLASFYPSPFVFKWNDQFTQSDRIGIDWLKGHAIPIDVNSITLSLVLERNGIATHIPPYHFNYNSTPYLGSSFNKRQYLIINPLDRSLYVDVFSNLAKERWSTGEFLRLDHDPSLSKVYCTGETDIWLINQRK